MKTLILEGSPRKQGHTAALVSVLQDNLPGEVEVIRCYEKNVRPCIDCRYCLKHPSCSQQEEDMAYIYNAIDTCDNIVLAAPMYFYTVPAPMKCVLDRLQVYWAAHIRKDRENIRPKKGALLLVGGAPVSKQQFTAAEISLKVVLQDVNASCEGIVCMSNTDNSTLHEQEDVKKALLDVCKILGDTK